VEKPLKVDLVAKLLPYLFPQLRPMDPDGVLSPAQAAGMLGNQATKFREALTRYVSDPTLIARVLDDLRTHPTHSNGAGAPVV
jgi:hypothetical protein